MDDAQIIEFAYEFRRGILGGKESTFMCFAVCAPLVSLLIHQGVEADLVESDLGICNHFWIRLADGRALDPTIDQFGDFPAVYLGDPIDFHLDAAIRSPETAQAGEATEKGIDRAGFEQGYWP